MLAAMTTNVVVAALKDTSNAIAMVVAAVIALCVAWFGFAYFFSY